MPKRRALGAAMALALMALALTCAARAAAADDLAVAPLSDGRLELFVILNGKLMTSWQKSTAPDSAWSPLGAFTPAPSGAITAVAAGRLPDGRLQIFLIGPTGVATSWKQSTDPDAGWTPWSGF
jgi:hypothetical protein